MIPCFPNIQLILKHLSIAKAKWGTLIERKVFQQFLNMKVIYITINNPRSCTLIIIIKSQICLFFCL